MGVVVPGAAGEGVALGPAPAEADGAGTGVEPAMVAAAGLTLMSGGGSL
jgi:hypothetical protein